MRTAERDGAVQQGEEREDSGELRVALQYLKENYGKEGDRLFSRVCCGRKGGNSFKLKERRFRLDIRKKVFVIRTVRYWDGLPAEVVDVPFLQISRVRLDGDLRNLILL